MRRILLFLLIAVYTVSYSQSLKDIYTSKEANPTWLGVDYSNAKFIGEFSSFDKESEEDMAQLRDEYFDAWNQLILEEPDKFEFEKMLRQKEVKRDIDMIMDVNFNADPSQMNAKRCPRFSRRDIQDIVEGYAFEDTGIGIVFIATCLNKKEEYASYYYILVDMSSGKILEQKKYKGEPSGFGLRNYWAGTVYQVMKQIKDDHRKKRRRYK